MAAGLADPQDYIQGTNPHRCQEKLTKNPFGHPGLHVEHDRLTDLVLRPPGHRWSAKLLGGRVLHRSFRLVVGVTKVVLKHCKGKELKILAGGLAFQ